MANEFKVKNALQILNTQPVTGISDSSNFTNDSSSLATINAIKGFIESRQLPIASDTSLGNVKIGNGLLIDSSGVLSTNIQSLPIASETSLGLVKIGNGLNIDASGVLSKEDTSLNEYVLPIASDVCLGGVIIGEGLDIDSSGILTINSQTLPIASAVSLGTIRVGSGLNIESNGVLNTNNINAINGLYNLNNNIGLGGTLTKQTKLDYNNISFNIGKGFNNLIYFISKQNDGKILVGGNFTSFNDTSINYITRLNSNGTLDASFNTGTGFDNMVYSLYIQSDGKILVSGYFTTYNDVSVNYLTRLNSDGTLDVSFNNNIGFDSFVQTINQQQDGKILVGGYFGEFNGNLTNHIARLNLDGTLDASFNTGTGFNTAIDVIVTQSDGKILVGGNFTNYNGTSINRLIRLNSDGTIDASFNVGTGPDKQVLSIYQQSDGKILVGGNFTLYNGTTSNYIVRVNSNGLIDASFNIGTGFNDIVLKIQQQQDGKILVGGEFTSYNNIQSNNIIRINLDGTKDASFNIGNGFNNIVTTIDIQNDNKLLVGGLFTLYNDVSTNYIARLNTNGTLDDSSIINTLLLLNNHTIDYGDDYSSYYNDRTIPDVGFVKAYVDGSGGSYSLPIASDTSLGGIKIGPGLSINNSGLLSTADNKWIISESNNEYIWNDICYGNNKFVIVGAQQIPPFNGSVKTSYDGINWQFQTSPSDNAYIWNAITFINELFIAVGYDNTNSLGAVMTSSDGINWQIQSSPSDNSYVWNSIDAGGYDIMVAVGYDDTNSLGAIMTSSDGINWQIQSSPSDNSYVWNDIKFYSKYIVVGNDNSLGAIMTSSDGINWQIQSSPSDNSYVWNSIYPGDNNIVAVGYDDTNSLGAVMSSSDGINWQIQSSPNDSFIWNDIYYSNGLFIAVGADNNTNKGVIMSSYDTVNWFLDYKKYDNTVFNAITSDNKNINVIVGLYNIICNNNTNIPIATSDILGGIKVGSGLSIDASGVLTSLGGGTNIIDITYENLKTLYDSSTLTKGQFYRITDYQTTYVQPISNVIMSGYIEPLIVQAIDINKISHEAKSEQYPLDIIHYNIDDNSCEDGTFNSSLQRWEGGTSRTGKIYYREDTNLKLITYYDWRNVKFRRWKVDSSLYDINATYNQFDLTKSIDGNIYVSKIDNNLGSEEPLSTNNNWNLWLDLSNIKYWSWTSTKNQFNLGYYTITDNLIINASDFIDYYTFSFLNDVSNNSGISQYGNYYNNILINELDLNSSFTNFAYNNIVLINHNETSQISFNIIGGNSYNCTINSYEFYNNNIANRCYCNVIGNNFSYNKIQSNFQSNIIQNYFFSNTIENDFYSNTITNYFYSNIIGNNFNTNIIGNNFYSNIIGNNFYSNTITNYFYSNIIGNNFNTNIIGNNFYYNKLGNYIYGNKISSDCYINIIGNNIANNVINGLFYSNMIGNYFYDNSIGYNFSINTIFNYFNTNTILSSFCNNKIDQFFRTNIIGDGFINNNVKNEVTNLDFTSSTYVYMNYDKTIFKTFGDNYRITFYDSNDNLNIIDATL